MKASPFDAIPLQFRDRRRWFCAGYDVHGIPRVWAASPHRDEAIAAAQAEAELHLDRFPVDRPLSGWAFKTWAPSREPAPFEPAE